MTVKKCNKCKKAIKNFRKDGISINVYGFEYLSADLCVKCATPFLKDLKKRARFMFDGEEIGNKSGK